MYGIAKRLRVVPAIPLALVLAACALSGVAPSSPPSSVTSASALPATPAASALATGAISGTLGYPAGSQPAMVVYAVRMDTNLFHYYSVRAGENQGSFTIGGLPPGVYSVVAYLESDPARAGAYTQFVLCGLAATCSDHSLVSITVRAAETVQGVKVLDWYAPPGTFPPKPTG